MQPVYSKGEFGIQQYRKIKPGKQTEMCWVIPYLYLCLQHALNTTPCRIFIQQSTQAAARLSAPCTTASPRVTVLPAHAGYSHSQHVHQIQEASELLCVCG